MRRRQGRRGLSSVVGAIFMIIVMAAGLNVALWTMQQQDRVTEAVVEKANSNLDKLNEEIEISDIRVSNNNNKLNMTVTNTGGAAANLRSVYIVNETAKMQYRYDIDLTVDGRNSVRIDTLPLVLKNDTKYSVKIASEAGNSATATITPLSAVALPMSLYIIPPTFTPGENVTVLFTVTNNITESNLARTVNLDLHYSVGCSPLGSENCKVTKHAEPPSNITMVGKGNTALFKWVFEVKVPDETYITFNASLVNAKQGNYVKESALAKLVDSAQTSFSSEIIVSSTLVQKPEIFLIVPSPYGESAEEGLWGVVVANPTNVTMDISRVVINTFSTKVSASHKMIDSGCDRTAIYPTTLSEWSCPHENMIEWKDVAAPESIGGLEAKSFMVRVEPGSLGAGSPEPAFMISVSVFTSMGQFTKTGYSSGMHDSSASLANIYLTDTTNPATAVENTHMFGHKNDIASGATVRLNVTVADLDTSSSTKIKTGTKLIVNVPRGFTSVNVVSHSGFDTPTITPYSDGSTQIVAALAEDVGDASTEAKILSFTAVTPTDLPDKRIYIMHTLVDGETTANFSVGTLAEIALQVNKS